MAGRRRRRSGSPGSTGPFDSSRMQWIKELDILKPVDRSSPDNDWPVFVLTDATVYRKDGRTFANPLLVHVEGPLIVRGHLAVDLEDEDQAPYLVRPSLSTAYIEIAHSDTYSIGDNPATIWVAGASGWFEIRPSAEYRPVHAEALEATTFYFSALVTYEEYNLACQRHKRSQRPRPPTLDHVLLRHAVRVGDGSVRDEVEGLCHKWAEFLISHFTRELTLNWDPTPFAKQMRDWYPLIHKRIIDTARGLIPPGPPPPSEAQHARELQNRRSRSARASSRNSGVESTLSRSRSPQPAPPSETPVPLPEKCRHLAQPAGLPAAAAKPSPSPATTPYGATPRDTPMSDAHSEAVDRLVAVLKEIAEETKIKKTHESTILSRIYFRCKFRQLPKEVGYKSSVIDICSYYAKELLARMTPEWKDTPWSRWLEEVAAKPWTPILAIPPEEFPAQTFRRGRAAPKLASATPAAALPPAINLKASTKRAPKHESEGEPAEDAWMYEAPVRSRRSGKAATLRLASASKKRPRSDSDPDGHTRGHKAARMSYDSDDDDDDDDDEDDDDDGGDQLGGAEDTGDDEVADTVESRLPLPEGAVRVVVHAERIPTTSPTGPDGTWTCEQEDCAYVVRSADAQEAQELIQAHFRDHEAQAEKIDLALKESRGHLPINHLIDKIQALGKAAALKKQAAVNGEPVPAPVKRRLLV